MSTSRPLPARRVLGAALGAATLLVVSNATALRKIGDVPPDFVVHDVDDHPSKLSLLRAGKPSLIVYEDKDGGGQNKPFLERLSKLRGADARFAKVLVVAVADVSSWDFWPAKGFVKDALRAEGKKAGTRVWADWSGAGRKALAAHASVSNLVLVDGKGKVVWASAGALTKAQQQRLLDVIAKLP